MPSFSQKYFLQPNYPTLWKSIYNGIADATFIIEIWIAIMKASADVLASLLLKIILNLSGIQKMLEVAKMFTPSLSFWQYLFYPKGSQWWTNSSSVRDMCVFSICYAFSWQHCFIWEIQGQGLNHQLTSSCVESNIIAYFVILKYISKLHYVFLDHLILVYNQETPGCEQEH